MSVYQDPDSQKERLIIVASLPGGASNVEFTLVGGCSSAGTSTARITYTWPKLAYDIDAIFAKQVLEKKMAAYHPKILALKKNLQDCRDTIDSTPKGVMELSLPIPVQTASDSITIKGGKQDDGTILLIVELMAFQTMYTVKKVIKSLSLKQFSHVCLLYTSTVNLFQ